MWHRSLRRFLPLGNVPAGGAIFGGVGNDVQLLRVSRPTGPVGDPEYLTIQTQRLYAVPNVGHKG